MFKQLRRRLLLMNLIMISIVMGIAFITIYLMTYRNIHESISIELHQESTFGDMEAQGYKLPPRGGDDKAPLDSRKEGFERVDERGGERVVTFSVNVDEEGNILNTNSMVEREDVFYEEILEMVIESKEIEGNLSFGIDEWAFRVSEKNDLIRYSFVDMTTEKAVLDRLVLTFIAVSVLTFMMIIVISSISTKRSLIPIRKTFDKQKQFISDASHELKTPLAVIGANVEVLLDNNQEEENQKWLNYIHSEVERMGKLTNDLLYLTQVENDEATNALQKEIEISDDVESMMLGLDAVCYEKDIGLNFEIEENLTFKGNVEQFVQVVLILMDNAIKYTPKGGNIQMKLSQRHNNITLKVRNTGSGIKDEDIPFLFDRFYRVDKARSRKDGSYGLGLSIARAIVEQHRGKITCDSIPLLETTFTVTLPI